MINAMLCWNKTSQASVCTVMAIFFKPFIKTIVLEPVCELASYQIIWNGSQSVPLSGLDTVTVRSRLEAELEVLSF